MVSVEQWDAQKPVKAYVNPVTLKEDLCLTTTDASFPTVFISTRVDAQPALTTLSLAPGDAENHQERSVSSANLTNTWLLTASVAKKMFTVLDTKMESAFNVASHFSWTKIISANLSSPAASTKTSNVFHVKLPSPIVREDV